MLHNTCINPAAKNKSDLADRNERQFDPFIYVNAFICYISIVIDIL